MQAKRDRAAAMASPWRRRRMCVLVADRPAPAALRNLSAVGAFLETNARPPLGALVELQHPEAGKILGRVCSIGLDGISLSFEAGERSLAFALAATAADMSRPAA